MKLLSTKTWFTHTAGIRLAVCFVLVLLPGFFVRAQERVDTLAKAQAADSLHGRIARHEPESADDKTQSKTKPVLAISTNLPYDITFIPGYGLTSIPSFSLEYYPSKYGHWTVGADCEFPMWRHWESHRFMQIQNLTINTRFYFKRGNYHGLYLLANVNAARYGIGWNSKGWEGEGLGASIGIGYKLTIYKRLFLDAGIAGGYFYSRFDPYEYGFDSTQRYYYDYVGVPEEFVRRNHALNWFGPTRVWIAIGIELFSRKTDK